MPQWQRSHKNLSNEFFSKCVTTINLSNPILAGHQQAAIECASGHDSMLAGHQQAAVECASGHDSAFNTDLSFINKS